MGSIALVLVQSHQSACALQIYLTRAPLACPDSAAAQFIPPRPFPRSPAGPKCPGDPAPAIETR